MKRIHKRNELIQKLFTKLSIITLGVKYKEVKLLINYNKNKKTSQYCDKVITLSYYGVKYFAKNGYSNNYYQGRHEKINAIVKNAIKTELRFVLLHELYHFKQRVIQRKSYDYCINSRREIEEDADDFAIDKIKSGVK